MKRPALGITIIERQQKGLKSFSLFARNGNEYLILINYRMMGLCLRSKTFQFSSLEQARSVYQKFTEKDQFRFSVRLAQKRSYDF